MIISELIEDLNKILKAHGDLDVTHSTYEYNTFVTKYITRVVVDCLDDPHSAYLDDD